MAVGNGALKTGIGEGWDGGSPEEGVSHQLQLSLTFISSVPNFSPNKLRLKAFK